MRSDNRRRITLVLAVALSLLLGGLGSAGMASAADDSHRQTGDVRSKDKAAKTAKEAVETAREPRRLSIYVPPTPRGSARRKSGGGTRGEQLPELEVLAPKHHEGHSADPQPTLYWYLDAATDVRVEFTLIDEVSEEPVVEVELPGPFEAGVHAIDLEAVGVKLEADIRYVWFVSLVPDLDRRSRDRSDGAPIRLRLAEATGFEAQAQAGLWYNALASLSVEIEGNGDLADVRATMLRAEGLEKAAAYGGSW